MLRLSLSEMVSAALARVAENIPPPAPVVGAPSSMRTISAASLSESPAMVRVMSCDSTAAESCVAAAKTSAEGLML